MTPSVSVADAAAAAADKRPAAVPNMFPFLSVPNLGPDDTTVRVEFELNPLVAATGLRLDTRLMTRIRGVDIELRAGIIKRLIDFFTPPPDVDTAGLKDLASTTLSEAKEQARAGLEYAVASKAAIQIDIQVRAPRIRMAATQPRYDQRGPSPYLLLDLGSFIVDSQLHDVPPDTSQLTRQELETLVYDDYGIEIQGVQMLLLMPADDEGSLCARGASPRHLLQPTLITGALSRCLRSHDVNLPQFKMRIAIDNVAMALSDAKLTGALLLVDRFLAGMDMPGIFSKSLHDTGDPTQASNIPANEGATSRPRATRGPTGAAITQQTPHLDSVALAASRRPVTTAEDLAALWSEHPDEEVAAAETDSDDDASQFQDAVEGSLDDEPVQGPQPIRDPQTLQREREVKRREAAAHIKTLRLELQVSCISIVLAEQDERSATESTLLGLTIMDLGMTMMQRPFDTRIDAWLSGLGIISYSRGQDDPYYMVYTSRATLGDAYLPSVKQIQDSLVADRQATQKAAEEGHVGREAAFLRVMLAVCDKNSPLFESHFNRTQMKADVDVTFLVVNVQQEALVDFIETAVPFAAKVQKKLKALDEGAPKPDQKQQNSALANQGGAQKSEQNIPTTEQQPAAVEQVATEKVAQSVAGLVQAVQASAQAVHGAPQLVAATEELQDLTGRIFDVSATFAGLEVSLALGEQRMTMLTISNLKVDAVRWEWAQMRKFGGKKRDESWSFALLALQFEAFTLLCFSHLLVPSSRWHTRVDRATRHCAARYDPRRYFVPPGAVHACGPHFD